MNRFMEEFKERMEHWVRYFASFFKWLIVSAIIGVIGGAVGALFHHCIELVTVVRMANSWLIFLLPVGGIMIVFLYHIMDMRKDGGTNLVLEAIRTDAAVPKRMTPLIFLGTIITHLFGGSAGREGAALQIGGSLGYNLGALLHFDEKDKHIMVMCGMSAVFSAMFGTPLTAAIFSMEVVAVGIIYYSAFVPCIIASTVAYGVVQKLGIVATTYSMNLEYEFSVITILKVIVLACICGLISVLFCVLMHKSSHLFKTKIKNDYLRIIMGGCLIIIMTLLVGNQNYNGAGMNVILAALHQSVPTEAFLLKILFTVVTIGAGYKGGEIVPTLFIGATLGCVVGPLLGLDAGFGAALGMISLFCGVVNCPIASIMLSLELFGQSDVLLFGIACGVSFVFSGYYSLYSSQKILYAKTKPEYINRDAY